jgi:DNA polymerase IV (DinB-like DNA polymerase)
MDAFFAAIEERDKPRLRGLPIVVGADPKDGAGRGVVSTASYAARQYGIHSAQPISQAWRLSEQAVRHGKPRAVFVESDHRRYQAVSREIMAFLRTAADLVEPASIDEAYLEKTKFKKQNEEGSEVEQLALAIKAHLLDTQRLTCSIGIGPNKLIAKIASGFEKPDGITVVSPEEAQKFLDPMSVSVIPGVGPKTEARLNRMKVVTVRDLRAVPEQKLVAVFGKLGKDLSLKAHGIDDRSLVTAHEAKSIGEQETFERDTLDGVFLIERLKVLSAGVYRSVAREGVLFKTISFTVRFSDFETKTRSRTLDALVRDQRTIESEALQLFLPFLDRRENPGKKLIRLIGVRVEKLEHL